MDISIWPLTLVKRYPWEEDVLEDILEMSLDFYINDYPDITYGSLYYWHVNLMQDDRGICVMCAYATYFDVVMIREDHIFLSYVNWRK